MTNELQGKVVVVSGGAGLLGKAFVRCIIQHGGTAIIADIGEKNGHEFQLEIEHEVAQGKAKFVTLDITSSESIESAIKQIQQEYGKIDALVNAAYPRNPNYGRKFEDVTYEDFCQNMSMHLGGVFLTSKLFAQYFKNQSAGAIVNIASIYGVVSPRFEIYENTSMTMPIEYAAIKAAVIHLTKYMAKYFKGYNIRVNCISPGGILDNQPEAFLEKYNSYGMSKGMLDVEDLRGALVFLLSDMSQFVNGQNLIVDDGWTL